MTKKRSYKNLPEEIMVEIFTWLPAKSVGQCRCLSKQWQYLLCKPGFVKTHLERARKHRGESIVFTSMRPSKRVFFTSLSNARHLRHKITIPKADLTPALCDGNWVYGSCDGLLLVGNCDYQKFILNPVTRTTKMVPPLPFARDPRMASMLGDHHGFGYDSINHDYKIVIIFNNNDININHVCGLWNDPCCAHMLVYVYSLKTESWKRVESPPYRDAFSRDGFGVFVDGSVHWLAERTTNREVVIMAFDLAEEKFREVPHPGLVEFEEFDPCCALVLHELGGCLCIFEENYVDVWVMKEYGIAESWSKFTINVPDAYLTMHIPDAYLTMPMCMYGSEQVVFLNWDVLVMYDPKRRTLKDIVIHGVPNNLRVRASFVESLVSPLSY